MKRQAKKIIALNSREIKKAVSATYEIIIENKYQKVSLVRKMGLFIWFPLKIGLLLAVVMSCYMLLQRSFLGDFDEYIIPIIFIIIAFFLIPKWERQKTGKVTNTISKSKKVRNIFLILAHFLFFGFLLIYVGKAFFIDSAYFIFYLYGISVTFTHLLVFYVALFRYEDPGILAKNIEEAMTQEGIPPKKPLVSCLIAVFNEEEVLETCIQSMIAQTYVNREIIFINDCSTDKTAEILDRYAQQGSIKVIHLPHNQGKKRALGTGIRQAKGSIFAMSDSDSIWEKDAIEIIVRIFNVFPNVGGVSGHGRALNPHDTFITKIQDSWYEGQFSIRKAFESVFGSITCVSGPLAVFRKETIYNYIPAWENDSFLGAPFKFATDRTLTGYVLGASVIGEGLKKNYRDVPFEYDSSFPDRDWDIVYCKSARSKTVVPDTFRRLVKQHARWKKSFLRNIFLTGKFYRKRPLLASIIYYLHIILVLVGPLVAARHLFYMPYTGDYWSPLVYISGIFFVGAAFGIAFKIEDRESTLWRYRPFMSIFSTLILSWLIIYSFFTIKKMTWSRD